MLDIALVRYICRSGKKEIATLLKQTYGGSLRSHYDWLDKMSKNSQALHDKRRIWQNCTIARMEGVL